MAISGDDLHLFNEGRHFHLYERLGAHVLPAGRGARFTVWAPEAVAVAVVGDFNGWDPQATPLRPADRSGLWTGEAPAAARGQYYKYHIVSRHKGFTALRADPFAVCAQTPPETASVIADLSYRWGDGAWMGRRATAQGYDRPISIYEVHAASWRQGLSYRALAREMAAYVRDMNFTHVEFMPVMEHPFDGSWGYQVTGYYAPTSRHGTPQDFMYLVDTLHQAGIGVILDWTPAHFPADGHGLAFFDGSHLYEHADPRRGIHPDWNSCIFNYDRNEVRSFLISNALFWLDRYHADGLRVDAVASMLYLDYSRREGEWIPNEEGGRENRGAERFLRDLNDAVRAFHPGAIVIAEESTAWPGVTRDTAEGGLGFDYKWDMGWMHDTLGYFASDPLYRKHRQNDLTFRALYAQGERFVLALSHDEVVHGKGSLLGRMPGDRAGKFANLRALYTYMYALPGKKTLFMGGEFGQEGEWDHAGSLDWAAAAREDHQGVARLVRELNRVYRDEEAFHDDHGGGGFCWIDTADHQHSVISFLRMKGEAVILCVFNFTPVSRPGYRIGVPRAGTWECLLDSDDADFGGGGMHGQESLVAEPVPLHGRSHSLALCLPPLAGMYWRWKS